MLEGNGLDKELHFKNLLHEWVALFNCLNFQLNSFDFTIHARQSSKITFECFHFMKGQEGPLHSLLLLGIISPVLFCL